MRPLKLALAAVASGLLAVAPFAAAPAGAQAPPSYQSSDPEKDAMMDEAPAEVSVTFDQPLDSSSWLKVMDECGKELSAGASSVQINEMTVAIGDRQPSGMYQVVYRAVGLAGATGTSSSSFEFMVHNGKPCAGAKKHDHGKKKKKEHHHHEEREREHDDHGDHDDDGGHSDHSGMSGMSGTDHGGHDTPASGGHRGGHGSDHSGHGNGRHPNPPETPDGPQTLAGGPGGSPVTADGQAVLVGLGLALAVGVLGGWLLRMSSKLAGTA